MVIDETFRHSLLQDTPKVQAVIRNIKDLDWLHKKCSEMFEVDKTAALKFMFHVFFEDTPYSIGNYDIYDSIALYMDDSMNDEVCQYIQKRWAQQKNSMSTEDKEIWLRECESWHCSLAR